MQASLKHPHRLALGSSLRKNVTIDKMSSELPIHSMLTYLDGIDSTHLAKLHQLCADLSTIAVDSYQPNLKYNLRHGNIGVNRNENRPARDHLQ